MSTRPISIVTVAVLFVASISTVSAEPAKPADSDQRSDTSAKANKAKAKANKAKAKANKAKAKANKAKAKANKAPLKLTVSETTAARSLDFSPLLRTQPTAEKRRGLSLGDDSSWKTHALQAGAMTALFGALVGLCGSGACTVPKGVTDPLPSWLKAKPHQVIDPRPPQRVRNL